MTQEKSISVRMEAVAHEKNYMRLLDHCVEAFAEAKADPDNAQKQALLKSSIYFGCRKYFELKGRHYQNLFTNTTSYEIAVDEAFFGKTERAMDLCQRVVNKLSTHVPLEKAYFARIFENDFNDFLRNLGQQKRKEMLSLDRPMDEKGRTFAERLNLPQNDEAPAQVYEKLKPYLDKLPERLSRPLLLRLQEASYEEISQKLDTPLNTVKAYIFQGKAQLKKILEQSLDLDPCLADFLTEPTRTTR